MSAQSGGGKIGLQASTVQKIAESKSIQGLSLDCAAKIANSVTLTTRLVVRTALRFQRAGRRRYLTVEDVDAAIRFLGLSPPFGYDTRSCRSFRFAGALVNEANMREDYEIELQPLLTAPLPKLPLAPVLRAHWLVIDGKQPAIPENPHPEVIEHLMSDQQPSTSLTSNNPPLLRVLAKRARKTMPVQIKTMTNHPVCLEQQIFFKEVMEAIMGNDEAPRKEALHTLEMDSGLQGLLPRFSVAIAEGVRCNVAQHNLALLIYHMRVVASLNQNSTLSLERVLHELLPSIMTCILSKKLCANPSVDNHWALREYSSKLLYDVCKGASANIRVRVIKVLSDVFRDPKSSFTTMWSAVFALSCFGEEVLSTVVKPIADRLRQEAQRIIRDKVPHEEDAATRLLKNLNRPPLNEPNDRNATQKQPSSHHQVIPNGKPA